MLTLTKNEITTAKTYTDGLFDGSIGLTKQDTSEEYLRGYFDGLTKFLNW